jgi:hypothetical protein
MMQFAEGAKKVGFFGKEYAAIISISPQNAEHFLLELIELQQSLSEWSKARGRNAKAVVITLVCKTDMNSLGERRNYRCICPT